MKEFLSSVIEGLARLGCGMACIPYPPDCEEKEPTLEKDSEPTLYK